MDISVIIPVKNRADLLPITLDNILQQSKKPYEVIVVDDGSTDHIESIISQYRDRVVFTKNKGRGPGAARNTGFAVSTGNAIQFFDSDDLMTKNKLLVQSDLLTKTNADFVYGPTAKAVYQDGTWKQTDVILQYFPLPRKPLANLVLEGWCAITQSVLFTRDLISEVGRWREDLMPHEDYELWFRIGKVVKSSVHENESCVIYRQHQNQITDKDVTSEARWIDGISASNHIYNGINYSASLHSKLIFTGKAALSKLRFQKTYQKSLEQKDKMPDYLAIAYYKFFDKLGRFQTGTQWQKMHGVLPNSSEQFKKYIGML